MRGEKKRSQHPGRRLTAAASRAQQSNGRSQKNDSIRDFESNAQGQRIRPEKNAGEGETCSAQCDRSQRREKIPFSNVDQDRSGKQADRNHEGGLLNRGKVTLRNLHSRAVSLYQARSNQQRPGGGPDGEVAFAEYRQHEQGSGQNDQQ